MRGLDYKSHTPIEITSTQLGAQATVCGGGRYDGLVEQLGGASTPAIGWAIGLERLVLLLSQLAPVASDSPDLYLVNRGEQAQWSALVLARQLRQRGLTVELDSSGAAFGKQFKRADRSGSAWAGVLGDGEVEQGVLTLKALRQDPDLPKEQTLKLSDLDQLVSILSA